MPPANAMAASFPSSTAASGCGGEKKRKIRSPSGFWFFLAVGVAVAVAVTLAAEAADVHKVGDSVGWTILGSPNYTAWSSSKKFKQGDTIVFEYNKDFHNVLEVNKADYKACNGASPIGTYATGNDSIVLGRKGHYFYICGFPGHCDAGQKVNIRVPKLISSAGPSPSAGILPPPSSSAPAGGSNAAAPPTQKSGCAAVGAAVGSWVVLTVLAVATHALLPTL